MTDYDKLVEALRKRAQRENEWYEHGGDIIKAAADAIEALQDTVQAQDKAIKECARQLAKMVPKRGEWVELGYQPNVHETRYRCSLCGRQVLILSGSGELLKTYPYCHCGAKMEVQE